MHYAAPPVVGGVEATIYHHARLLAAVGYIVEVIAGRGEPFHPLVRFHAVPELDSQHPDVLAVGRQLAKGECTAAFEALRDRLVVQLREPLADVAVCIVHNVLRSQKNYHSLWGDACCCFLVVIGPPGTHNPANVAIWSHCSDCVSSWDWRSVFIILDPLD